MAISMLVFARSSARGARPASPTGGLKGGPSSDKFSTNIQDCSAALTWLIRDQQDRGKC